MSRGSCGRARSRPCAGPPPAAHARTTFGGSFASSEEYHSRRLSLPEEYHLRRLSLPAEHPRPRPARVLRRRALSLGAPPGLTSMRPARLRLRPMIAVFGPGRAAWAGGRTRWPKLHPRVVRCTHAIVLYRRSEGLTPAGSSLTTSVPAAYPAATNAASHHDAPSITCAYLRARVALGACSRVGARDRVACVRVARRRRAARMAERFRSITACCTARGIDRSTWKRSVGRSAGLPSRQRGTMCRSTRAPSGAVKSCFGMPFMPDEGWNTRGTKRAASSFGRRRKPWRSTSESASAVGERRGPVPPLRCLDTNVSRERI
jgi:hypothetical protein